MKTKKASSKIKIKITAVGYLKTYINNKEEKTSQVAKGSSIHKALSSLKIPADEVMMVTVNGKHASKDDILQDNDHIKLIPLMGGG
ncbi:MAG: MoaD/ThiS family protein [Armatimonadota bacterium]